MATTSDIQVDINCRVVKCAGKTRSELLNMLEDTVNEYIEARYVLPPGSTYKDTHGLTQLHGWVRGYQRQLMDAILFKLSTISYALQAQKDGLDFTDDLDEMDRRYVELREQAESRRALQAGEISMTRPARSISITKEKP